VEELCVSLLKEYGYVILFLWSIIEGEMGLIAAGILSHTGEMKYGASVFVAGLGGLLVIRFIFPLEDLTRYLCAVNCAVIVVGSRLLICF